MAASGIAAFIPTIWSHELLLRLRNELVFGQPGVINRNYQGEISGAGSTVKIFGQDDVTVRDYQVNADILLDTLTSSEQEMLIDQAKYFGFIVDDVEEAQSAVKGVMDVAMSSGGYRLAETADLFIANKIFTEAGIHAGADTVSAGVTTVNALQVTKAAEAYDLLVWLNAQLTRERTPKSGRYAIIPPEFTSLIQRDPRFVANSDSANQVLVNGVIGKAAGIVLLESNNTVGYTSDSDAGVLASSEGTPAFAPVRTSIVVGHSVATTFADQILKVEAMRSPTRFGDLVRGLHVYGAQVVRPECLAVAEIDIPSGLAGVLDA